LFFCHAVTGAAASDLQLKTKRIAFSVVACCARVTANVMVSRTVGPEITDTGRKRRS
jgi:hypothetical protein